MARPYQVQRDQLSDQQWADFCRLMELSRELKKRVRERQAEREARNGNS